MAVRVGRKHPHMVVAAFALLASLVPPESWASGDSSMFNANDVAGTGTLRVSTVLAADDPEGDQTLGPGVYVRIDAAEIGVTDETGVLEVTLAPGAYDVEAVIPSMAHGFNTVEVIAGKTTEVTLRLDSGRTVYDFVTPVLNELVNGALSLDTDAITLRFERGGAHVPVSSHLEVAATTGAPDSVPTDLTAAFSLQANGTIAAHDLEIALSYLASTSSKVTLNLSASDDEGFTYFGTVTFVPGRFDVEIQLEAPPSRRDLPVGGVTVRLRAGDFEWQETTDASGIIWFPDTPAGLLQIEATLEFDGHVYSGMADASIRSDQQIRIVLLGYEDILNEVRPWYINNADFDNRSADTFDP